MNPKHVSQAALNMKIEPDVPEPDVNDDVRQIADDLGLDIDFDEVSVKDVPVEEPEEVDRVSVRSVPKTGTRTIAITEEQAKRQHVTHMLHDMGQDMPTSFGIELERSTEIKSSKIERISALKTSWKKSEGLDTSEIPMPTLDSPMHTIDAALNHLTRLNNRTRYSTIAQEAVGGVATILENVFDGTTEIPFFKVKPNYTGYKKTVDLRMMRMKHETSQIVSNVVDRYGITPEMQVFVDLGISFIMYPMTNKGTKNEKHAYNDLLKRKMELEDLENEKNIKETN
jgi:hypothetical protein